MGGERRGARHDVGSYTYEEAGKRTTALKKTETSTLKLLQLAGLYSKRIKHETSQKNDQEKLRQGKRTNRKQNNDIEPSTKATKRKYASRKSLKSRK